MYPRPPVSKDPMRRSSCTLARTLFNPPFRQRSSVCAMSFPPPFGGATCGRARWAGPLRPQGHRRRRLRRRAGARSRPHGAR
eukprot:6200776-Pleurochrysis_carterae.AAC.1